jgi:hypothetical protein
VYVPPLPPLPPTRLRFLFYRLASFIFFAFWAHLYVRPVVLGGIVGALWWWLLLSSDSSSSSVGLLLVSSAAVLCIAVYIHSSYCNGREYLRTQRKGEEEQLQGQSQLPQLSWFNRLLIAFMSASRNKLWHGAAAASGLRIVSLQRAEATVKLLTTHVTRNRVMLCCHPHGITMFPGFYVLAVLNSLWEQQQQQPQIRMVAAPVLFKVPIVRELHLALGAVDAGKRTVRASIARGMPLAIAVGGVREIFCTRRGAAHDELITSHKGFIKLALEDAKKRILLPVFAFAGNEQLEFVNTFPRLNRWLLNNLRLVVPGLVGVFGRWFSLLPCADAPSVTVCLGDPLELPHFKHPTQAQIDEWHTKYFDRLRTVYDTCKRDIPGCELRSLVYL